MNQNATTRTATRTAEPTATSATERTATRPRAFMLLAAIAMMIGAVAFAQDTAVNLSDGSTENGAFLVDGNGMSLYLFMADQDADTSTCTGDCATNWPAFTVASADALPTAGEGVDASLFGTVTRDDGSIQVTYNGWPLYYFAQDAAAGDVNGQGAGDNWYLVTAGGEPANAAAAQ